jgi:hypothetical protein
MKVVAIENGRFNVSSADGDGSYYLVDVAENGGIGQCSCPDFATRCQKEIDAKLPFKDYPDPKRHHCKHIHAAINFLGKHIACRMAGTEFNIVYGQS